MGGEITLNISTEMGGDVSQTFPISLNVCLKDSPALQLAKQLQLVLHCLLES